MKYFVSQIYLYFVCLGITATLSDSVLIAQTNAGYQASVESRYIIDLPTAGVLTKGSYAVNGFLYDRGGLMLEASFAPFVNFNVGLSYGAIGAIGNTELEWQSLPGIHLRYRVFDETHDIPAIMLGLQTQGRGVFTNDEFRVQSPGLFLALSKNFELAGWLGLHGGVHYSFETVERNRDINAYLGAEKTVGSIFSLVLEYNLTLAQDHSSLLERTGLLNIALRAYLGKGVTVELQLQDILQHYNNTSGITRTIAIESVSRW